MCFPLLGVDSRHTNVKDLSQPSWQICKTKLSRDWFSPKHPLVSIVSENLKIIQPKNYLEVKAILTKQSKECLEFEYY